MLKIIKVIFFSFLFLFHAILISEEYSTIVQGNDEDVSELLRKALNQSILKVLGSQRDFNLNQKTLKKLNPDNYVKEYKFIKYRNEEALEVMIDLKVLQEKLLKLNLGISFLKNPKVAAWVFCKSDFSCKFTKKELNNIANERGITLIYPILDSQDISLFSLENDSEIKSLTIFNDRYPSDGWFFCEISSVNEWCFLPKEIDKKLSTLDTETRYKPAVGFNILIDNLYSKQRLKPEYQSNQPYFVEISGLKKFIEHKHLEKKLQDILFISDLSLLSIQNNSATYSFYLLSEEKNLIDYLNEIDNLNLISIEKRKVFLAFGDT